MTPPAVADRLATLRHRRSPDAEARCLAVRDLVVVCSSSRGGSSLFGELLRGHPGLLGFSAELNPHVTIPTLGHDGGCDLVADPSPVAGSADGLPVLRHELGGDLGRADPTVLTDDVAGFADHVAWRLTMQWPAEPIDPDAVADDVDRTLADITHFDRTAFLLALLGNVRHRHANVDPYRYDVSPEVVAGRFPDVDPPAGPSAEPIVEMAPFVAPRPWRAASGNELGTAPVIATTPRNAFRLRLLAAAFPQASVRVVHLTRNPAAAVNGLYDGWLHHGFFSCRSDVPLRIDGYDGPWSGEWWSYDVPPGWRSWVDRPLAEVCGHQWRAAHRSTIDTAAQLGWEVHRIAFEDVVGPPQRRLPALESLAAWLGVDPAPLLDAASGTLPVVMPTHEPRPGRWRRREDVLAPVLGDRATLELAAELGYSRDPSSWQ